MARIYTVQGHSPQGVLGDMGPGEGPRVPRMSPLVTRTSESVPTKVPKLLVRMMDVMRGGNIIANMKGGVGYV